LVFLSSVKTGLPIAYIGCIVTILAIAIDPFAQQILQFVELERQVPGLVSSVPLSKAYDLYLQDTFFLEAGTHAAAISVVMRLCIC
jgi:hypothetical protein